MRIRTLSAVLALGLGLVATAEAQAWFAEIEDERPPPNGANGLSANGFVINGLALQGFASERVEAVILKDGARVLIR